jgi:hypothetical protein
MSRILGGTDLPDSRVRPVLRTPPRLLSVLAVSEQASLQWSLHSNRIDPSRVRIESVRIFATHHEPRNILR